MEIRPTNNAMLDCTVNSAKRPKVLIVGAGLAGLTLALLLQKANIPYEVFERAQESKPLGNNIIFYFYFYFVSYCDLQCPSDEDTFFKTGSATVLTSQTSPLLRQLGLEEEFNSLSKVLTIINVGKENREIDFQITLGSKDAMER